MHQAFPGQPGDGSIAEVREEAQISLDRAFARSVLPPLSSPLLKYIADEVEIKQSLQELAQSSVALGDFENERMAS